MITTMTLGELYTEAIDAGFTFRIGSSGLEMKSPLLGGNPDTTRRACEIHRAIKGRWTEFVGFAELKALVAKGSP